MAHYDPDQFTIWTGWRRADRVALWLFLGVGGAIEKELQRADAIEAGGKFLAAAQLTDPIRRVKDRFLETWQLELGLTALPPSRLLSSNHIHKLHEEFGMGYVIDFRTEKWSIEPALSDRMSYGPSGYRAVYMGRARLIRLQDQSIVWQGTCEYGKESSLTPSLSQEQITGTDQGAAVKVAIKALADVCADSLWRQFFGRESGPDFKLTTVTETTK